MFFAKFSSRLLFLMHFVTFKFLLLYSLVMYTMFVFRYPTAIDNKLIDSNRSSFLYKSVKIDFTLHHSHKNWLPYTSQRYFFYNRCHCMHLLNQFQFFFHYFSVIVTNEFSRHTIMVGDSLHSSFLLIVSISV